MTRWLARLDRWYRADVPRERLRLVRIALGGYSLVYLVSRGAHLTRPTHYPAAAFSPVGIVSVLAKPLSDAWVYGLWFAATLGAVAFTAGVRHRAVAPAFAALLLWVTSYRHSWGMVFHTDNLWVLHVLLLSLADAGRRADSAPEVGRTGRGETSGWVLQAMSVVTVSSYLVAGVAKLQVSGISWAHGEVLRGQIAYDAIRKIELGSLHSPLGPWLLPHGWLFAPLSAFSLAAELLAPLALLGRRWAATWCTAAWLFHLGVVSLMAIAFPYPLSGCAFLSFAPLERWRGVPWLRQRFFPGTRGPAEYSPGP